MLPNISNNGKIGNNLFDSMGLMAGPREKLSEEKAEKEIDDFLYELPDVGMPTLELGDKLLNIFGTEGEDLFNDLPTKKEEEDEVLQNIIDEYNIPEMKETMDETGEIPENIYFFYGGKSDYFFNALEFLRISPVNREFAAFLLSDLGRKTMTQNKLSIHVESGDIFYDNHKTDENFYSFLLSQQNDEAAYVPKKFSYNDTFEKYITSFLQNFSIDDQEKFDLLAFKNSKYLFYRFNDFMKMYGNPRYKLLHTKKMLDSKALEKLENKNKQFLIDKIIQGVEFENAYESNPEKNPEIIRTIESNYKIARRVCQQLYFDVAELFHEYFQSIDLYEQQDIEEDMKINGWGTVENIRTIKDSMRLLNLFQDFYTATGRLPIFNKLLVVPDGEAKPEKIYIYMKQLYDMFKNTNSHGIVSLPFLGLLLHYFHDLKSMNQVNTATTELYKNLSYMTLSGGRQLEFQDVSDLIAQLSFSIKSYTILNQKQAKIENEILAKKINDGRIFNPKIENPLDDVIEIIDDPNTEHKKTAFLYVEPTVQLPDEIEDTQKLIDDDYADLLNKIYGVNDVLKEQKKNKKVEDLIDDVIKEPPPTDDY